MKVIVDGFWKEWRREYLVTLRDFHAKKRYSKGGKLNLDDLVIVEDEKLPRNRWKLGRVVELVLGTDGILRGARVMLGKTGNIIGRPLNKLCHLELSAKVDDSKSHSENPAVNLETSRAFRRKAAVKSELITKSHFTSR